MQHKIRHLILLTDQKQCVQLGRLHRTTASSIERVLLFCGFGVFFLFVFVVGFFKVSDQSVLEVHELLKKSTITLVRFLLKAY